MEKQQTINNNKQTSTEVEEMTYKVIANNTTAIIREVY